MVAVQPGLQVPRRSDVAVTGLIGLGATTLLAAVDPNQTGHYPTCPLLALTGLYCPFCGGMRAVHDLVHLDLLGALARNPLVVVMLPFVVLAWLAWARSAFTGRRAPVAPHWLLPAVLVLLAGFGILRNVPGWSWLSPA